MKTLSFFLVGFSLIASAHANAHPHDDGLKSKPPVEKQWPYFGDKSSQAKTKSLAKAPQSQTSLNDHFDDHAKRLREKLGRASAQNERVIETLKERLSDNQVFVFKDGDDVRETTRALETMIAESGLLSNIADMMVDLVEDIEVNNDEDGLTLRFDGETLGRMKIDHESQDNLTLEGLGRNMTIDKQVIKKDGKTRTRIVIELDGEDEVDLDIKPQKLPKTSDGF